MAAMLLAAGCAWRMPRVGPQPVTMIDWVDFIKLKGITYYGAHARGQAPGQEALGEAYGEIMFQVGGNVHDPDYKLKDGDAAYLAAGTKVYTVKGYRPEFRVAVVQEGRVRLFDVGVNPAAKTGADLLDLAGKVTEIRISTNDGGSNTAILREPALVGGLVSALLAAPTVKESPTDYTGQPYLVTFVFKDGTETRLAYRADAGLITTDPRIKVPENFAKAISEAIGKGR